MVLSQCEICYLSHHSHNYKYTLIFQKGPTGELLCKADDCYLDRLEACASKSIPDFPKFVCCNNRGKSYHKVIILHDFGKIRSIEDFEVDNTVFVTVSLRGTEVKYLK